MSGSGLFKARRTAKSDPALGRQALFSAEIDQLIAAELPPEVRVILHFTGETMPAQWLAAVRQNGESYSGRDQSVAVDFQSLSPALATEFAWGIERQVQLGMNIDAEATAKPRLTTASGLSARSGCSEQGREAGGQPGPRAPGEDLPPGDGAPGI